LKVSVVVSKKVSKKAVVRNRIKRRMRHIAFDILRDGAYIIIARENIADEHFIDLKNEFKKTVDKFD